MVVTPEQNHNHNQEVVQTFGDINATISGEGNKFVITNTQIIQVAVAEIKTRPLIESSPYKGLKRFESVDKDLFFGREQAIVSLMQAVSQNNLVLVLGASGSGKSSLVRAGLIPQFAQRLGAKFNDLTFTPDRDPFESWRVSLIGKGYKQSEVEIARQGDIEKVVQTLKMPEAQWLLFIDQFEELFTLTQDTEKRQRFITSLVRLAESEAKSVKIVLAMRADFLDRFSPHPKLGQIAQQTIHLVTDMHDDELRLVIEQPAASHGVVFEEGLVEEIIKDLRGQAGSLPLLQYTLDLLWQNDDISDRTLNVKTYRELGGVRGALQKHVDQIYQNLSEGDREATKQIFLRLVDIAGTEASDVGKIAVNRRAYLSEFSDKSAHHILPRLVDANLLVSNRQPEADRSTVEIAHEILIQSWSTLNQWIEESRETIAIRNRLSEDAQRWDTSESPEDELWSGSKLQRVEELREKGEFERLGGLSELENRFVEASVTKRDRLARLEEERRKRELRRAWITAGAAICAGVVMVGVSVFAWGQWRLSEISRLNADVQAFSASSEKLFTSEKKLEALVTALKAAKRLKEPLGQVAATSESRWMAAIALKQVVYGLPAQNRLEDHTQEVLDVQFSPNGQMLASSSRDGTVRFWKPDGTLLKICKYNYFDGSGFVSTSHEDSEVDTELEEVQGYFLNSISFSPDGETIAVGTGYTNIELISPDCQSIRQLQHHQDDFSQSDLGVESVTFSPNGQIIASGGGDGSIKIQTLTGEMLARMTDHESWVTSVVFSSDGQMVASASRDGTVKLWQQQGSNAKKWKLLKTFTHSNEAFDYRRNDQTVWSVAFSHDHKIIASAGEDGKIKLWNIDGKLIDVFSNGMTPVRSVRFSPDGKFLVTGNGHEKQYFREYLGNYDESITDNSINVWTINGILVAKFVGHNRTINRVVFSPNSQVIASASSDNTVNLWSLKFLLNSQWKAHEKSIKKLNFSNDVSRIASASDKQAKSWDLNGNLLKNMEAKYAIDFSMIGKNNILVIKDQGLIETLNTNTYFSNKNNQYQDFYEKIINKNKKNQEHYEDIISTLSPDGKYILTAEGKVSTSEIKLWSFDKGFQTLIKLRFDRILNANFSPDSKLLAIHSQPGGANASFVDAINEIIELFKLDGTLVATLAGHKASFSPDTKIIATAGEDGIVRLYKPDGSLIKNLRGHSEYVTNVTFSPDGEILASASDDKTVRLWSSDGTLLRTFPLAEVVNDLSFSPDGKTLALGNSSGYIVLWNFDLDNLLSRGCYQVRNYLKTNPNVKPEDRHLCDDIPPAPPPEITPESLAEMPDLAPASSTVDESQPIATSTSEPEPTSPPEAESSTETTTPSHSYDFPLDTCGDSDSDGNNTWYPVYVDYSEETLEQIRQNYCGDAIKNWREEEQKDSIQVGSFLTSEDAEEFARIMVQEVGSGEVGTPTVPESEADLDE